MLRHASISALQAEVLPTAALADAPRAAGALVVYPVVGMPTDSLQRCIAVGVDIRAEDQSEALLRGASDVIDLAWAPELIAKRLIQLFVHEELLAEHGQLRNRVATHFAAKERDLADAREMQLALVPPGMADARLAIDVVLEPALELGGDLVDYIAIADGRIVVAVGDVSGKGAAAALTMARTHTLLRSLALRPYAAEIFSPPDIAARRLNGMLAIENDGCIFVTMFLGLLDPETGALSYIRGGQIPPFLRRRDGAIERLDAVGGLPLGIRTDAAYTVGHAVLNPGDTLLIVSDGVTEAEAPDGRLLDDEPVVAWLAEPREEMASLVALTRAHEEGGAPTDDLSAMLIRFR
ncbi:MAG: PP2C family protein-serine/threonine phosphatase [Pseudomonadota bacterium]